MSDTITTISPSQARKTASSGGAILIDVRTPGEFASRRAIGALNVPLDSLSSGMSSFPRETCLLILCEKGGRAAIAAKQLIGSGYTDVHVVSGGTEAWASDGLPIEGSGRKPVSIERQVRIGAGTLVLIGVILGFLLNPGFFCLSAFVGAGLVFAGITDWCGMGLLLARAPWNR